ncbi:hypothetical protein EVA_15360 [gut metagenome]|uniref:Uncharacterized protein n=1 Tax=gut metagenome TaxID=749906 RepID=J9GAW9_9ZZZZ
MLRRRSIFFSSMDNPAAIGCPPNFVNNSLHFTISWNI